MRRHVLNVVEVELVDLDVLCRKIENNEFKSYYEMQHEDNTLDDYYNPYEYLSDLPIELRASINCAY